MEHSSETREPRRAAIKLLAIVGFFALLAVIAWGAVQAVRAFPNAFSSLASIAESIQGYSKDELEITLEKNIVNAGETFKVTWTDMKADGVYHFGYSCVEGVILSVRTDESMLREIACTENLELPKEANGLFVSANSKAQRFSDLTFSVRFDAKNGVDQIADDSVTIVNATIAMQNATPTTTPDVSPITTAPVATTTPEIPKPVVPTPPKPVVTAQPSKPVTSPQVGTTIVSIIPVSDPNGFVDLKMNFVAAGKMSGSTFTPVSAYDTDDRAGLRFEVKNIGTKRSGTWTYTIELPEGKYTSDAQSSLEPNERAVFTMSFDFESNKNSVTLKGETEEKNDTNSRNDSFSWSVKTTN